MKRKKENNKSIVKSGWGEFLTEKYAILDGFDKGKAQTVNRPTKVDKGKFAEAEFRKWLKQFLPKKYDVTSGYIISQKDHLTINPKLLHYDVIIYDQLSSPVLWVENNADQSEQGRVKAIPAEYVHGVLEVKSTLNKKNLFDLIAIMNGTYQSGRLSSWHGLSFVVPDDNK